MPSLSNSILASKWTKVVVFLACLVPFGILVWEILNQQTGANPVQFVEHALGDWTLRFIVFTLAVTPLRKKLRLPQLIRFRRMLGLYAFFYACMHFTSYLWLDKYFMWRDIWADLYKRTYIIAGFTGFILLVPLAITSTAGWIRRLGGRRWQRLHRLIYVTAIAGVIHYYWLVKSDERKPLFYGFLVAILLAWRLGSRLLGGGKRAAAAGVHPKEPSTAETA